MKAQMRLLRVSAAIVDPRALGYTSDIYLLVVSRAFQILSDSDKKSRYDKFGGDPDSRFNPGPSSGGSPFSGFGGGGGFPRGGAGPAFDAEISPEELFNRFFNSGFGGMGGGFSPFGMFCRNCIWQQKSLTLEKVVPSSYSIWEEGQASECISSEDPCRAEDLARPPLATRSPLLTAGLSFVNCYLLSSSSFFLCSHHCYQAPRPRPVPPTLSMRPSRRIPWVAQHRNCISTIS